METRHEQIARGLASLGIDPPAGIIDLLERHLALVFEANQVLSLTSIAEAEAVGLHLLDSASALPFLLLAPDGPFADLGSGPGYPGVPLGVLSGRQLTLVESVRKKAAFLEHVVDELRLKATVRGVRAEELALERPSSFTAVTARALSSLPSLVELAAPLLMRDGLLVCLKGRPEEIEIERGDAAARRCGLRREATTEVSVPGLEAARAVITYRSVGDARLKLPRRTGLAQTKPLA